MFASGSPFGKVTVDIGGGITQTYMPGQCNNSYIFPAIGLATLACKLRPIPNEAFAVAAEVGYSFLGYKFDTSHRKCQKIGWFTIFLSFYLSFYLSFDSSVSRNR